VCCPLLRADQLCCPRPQAVPGCGSLRSEVAFPLMLLRAV
jgi:hypothetical protein